MAGCGNIYNMKNRAAKSGRMVQQNHDGRMVQQNHAILADVEVRG